MTKEPRTPSMDDKHIPSPPTRTNAQYAADKAAGIERVGKSYDAVSWAAKEAAEKEDL